MVNPLPVEYLGADIAKVISRISEVIHLGQQRNQLQIMVEQCMAGYLQSPAASSYLAAIAIYDMRAALTAKVLFAPIFIPIRHSQGHGALYCFCCALLSNL